MNTHVHLVVPDLFLPPDAAGAACADLRTPALGKILARAQPAPLPAASVQDWLCAAFGVKNQGVAPITLQADGADPGTAYWLRADPVHLVPRGEQLVVRPIAALAADEASALCDTLNRHFAGDGLHFVAPRPQRWYLRLNGAPETSAHPAGPAAGGDIAAHLPRGGAALQWHKVLNEIQMLLHEHPVNQAREARGEWLVNSVWLWGGGQAPERLLQPCAAVYTDNALAAACAEVAGIRCASLPDDGAQCLAGGQGELLIVWDGLTHALQHGDLCEWRASLERFERHYAVPLLHALRSGRAGRITMDAVQAHGALRFALTRGGAWQFWRFPRRLESYAR